MEDEPDDGNTGSRRFALRALCLYGRQWAATLRVDKFLMNRIENATATKFNRQPKQEVSMSMT